MKFQEWCKEILPIVIAGAQGKAIECKYTKILNATWVQKELAGLEGTYDYRIKPRIVNGFEVAESEVDPLEDDQNYFYPAIGHTEWYTSTSWDDESTLCANHLARGFVHLNKEDAIAHAKAMAGVKS